MAKCYDNYSKEELIELLNKRDKELANKKYGLVWDSEKEPEQVVLDCENNLPILERIKEKEIKTDNSDYNILIEGDNFHSLSVLNYTHKEKIDVIYIDPPYNTGNKDFIYNDSFVDKEDGYRHSKWLNFMEKRLNLANKLMKDSGVIFISIDDNEQANLKLLCDKIFGESNKIAVLPTIMNLKGNQDEFGFAGTHEYTLVYAKNKSNAQINEFKLDEENFEEWLEDETGYYKKGAILKRTGTDAPREKRPLSYYPILINKATDEIANITELEYFKIYNKAEKKFDDNYIDELKNKYEKLNFFFLLPLSENIKTSWRWQYSKVVREKDEIIVQKSNNSYTLYKKQRPNLGELPTKKPKTIFYKPEYSSGNGTNRLKQFFGEKLFNNPKPLDLIKDLIYLGSKKDSVILDFTAGSGTTADAVLSLNKEDGGNRHFILCTDNENNICTNVCYPRIEKVINGYHKNGKGEFVKGMGGNLLYFRTSFIKNSQNKEQLKINLTQKCTEMLCVKEGIYNQKEIHEDFKIFESNKKDKYLCVYYNFISNSFFDFVNTIKQLKGKKIIYVFSTDDSVDVDLFAEIKNCTIETIPQKILDIYKKIIKDNIKRG